MNRQLKSLFVAIKDNEVVVFETNLKAFIDKLSNVISDCPEYMWFYRRFEKTNVIQYETDNGCFYFQKLK